MGQDFRAIMGHRIDCLDSSELLQNLDRITLEMSEELRTSGLDLVSDPASLKSWQWVWGLPGNRPDMTLWERGESLSLSGPKSLTVILGQHSLSLGCWIRWQSFVRDRVLQDSLRRMTYRFAKLFGANCAIYVPDSNSTLGEGAQNMVHEGASIEEILRFVMGLQDAATPTDLIGKPSLPSSSKDTTVGQHSGYCIDLFADLSAE